MRKPIHLTVAMLTLGLTSPALATEADWEGVEKALGVPGSMEPGDVYKVSLPRSDLKVTADGVPVKPPLRSAPGSPLSKPANLPW
jgi:Domain of Unknown Function (DUF1259)